MDDMKNVTGIVKYFLEEEPSTRNSDYELYFHVCKMLNPHTLAMQFGKVLKHREELGLPSIESVGRARRKIVEKHPELAGTDKVESIRTLNEEAFREYAKGVIV